MRFTTSISMNEEENKYKEICIKHGYSIMDIFRLGLNEAIKQIDQGKDYEKTN